MAVDQGSQSVVVTTQERTWRVNIETAKGADPVVTVFRELIKWTEDGTMISRGEAQSATRSLSAVANDTITVPGTAIVITMAQVAATIAATADLWRQEDMKTEG